MSNYSAGHQAEVQAADYLKNLGFEINELNWKTKYCEIDIIATKDNRIYFVEIKSRKVNLQGYGFDYITPKKIKQMTFAAEMWVSNHHWSGEYQLAAVSVDNDKFTFIDEF